MIRILLISETELTDKQRLSIQFLEKQCFSEVDPEEAEECFYAETLARILAYNGKDLVGARAENY